MLKKKEINDLIYTLECKHDRRLSSGQKNVIFASYDEFGVLPSNAIFKSLTQRDVDLKNDSALKAIHDKEMKSRAAQRARLEKLFPILTR